MQRNEIKKEHANIKKNLEAAADSDFDLLYLKLLKYCQFLSRNKWDGEDLAQEAVYKTLKQYEHKSDMNSPLLHRIAHNVWMDKIRKHSRETIRTVPDQADKQKDMSVCLAAIDELISKLTPKQLVVFTLVEAFQFKNSETAEMLHMSESAVKGLLLRTRTRLKNQSYDKGKTGIEEYWTDDLQKEMVTVLFRSIQSENPELLIKFIPKIIAIEPKMVFQSNCIRTYSAPSSYLSIAA